jgi:anti-sigma B factor antagonist
MAAPLHIIQRTIGAVTVLELSGHLVIDEGDRLLKTQVTALTSAGRRHVLIDLRNVTYIDSGGIGALVSMYVHVLQRGGSLKLLAPSVRVAKVLRITYLVSVFEVFESLDEAIRSFEEPTAAAAGAAPRERPA